ncbi:MAG: 2Fe-2S iron-sulfur cluster-binding protein [Vicinamibacterales bacterium]
MASDDQKNPDASVSRRAFLKGSAVATGALSSTLIPAPDADAQLPVATEPDPRHTVVTMKVNGVSYRKDVPNHTTLLRFLREDLKLTGAKMGCDRSQCGACTVIVNGRNVYSCTTLAVEATGAEVLTIEGLATGDALHPIQQAFIQHSGFQCGFCTSGQIMTTKVFLERVPRPTEDEARRALSGNLCRCAAYKRILESVMTASRLMQA